MKIKYGWIFLFLAMFVSACNVNLNVPNGSRNNADVKMRWSAVVCSSKAATVTMFAGSEKDFAENFAVWEKTSEQKKFDLPANLQKLSKVYFKAVSADRQPVEMCVLYDGKAKKRIEFDDEEDVHVNMTDTDSVDKCRCVE